MDLVCENGDWVDFDLRQRELLLFRPLEEVNEAKQRKRMIGEALRVVREIQRAGRLPLQAPERLMSGNL